MAEDLTPPGAVVITRPAGTVDRGEHEPDDGARAIPLYLAGRMAGGVLPGATVIIRPTGDEDQARTQGG